MKLDPVLLNMACSWSMKAYNDKNKDAIKIENSITGATAFVIKRKTIDIIAFRGTEKKLNDILTDLCVIPVWYAGRLCHGGFALAHKSIWKQILPHIDPNKRTLITGHSLGGGLSEISAALLMQQNKVNNKKDNKKDNKENNNIYKNINVITFGKPNVFFKGFKRPMDLDTQLSVINHCDSVARIPRLCYGPSTSQQVLYFGGNGLNHIDPSKEFKKEDRKLGEIKERATDHYIDNYKKRLKDFLEEQDKILNEDEIKELNKIADEVENA